MNKIQVIGEINEESFALFSQQMTEIEESDADSVVIELHSSGGVAVSALAFNARMRLSRLRTTVMAYGYVASAATLILAAGTFRIMAEEAWVMVHEDSGRVKGTVTKQEIAVKQLRIMENQWNHLLEKYTGTSAEEWAALNLVESHLSADACKRLGLVDKVV